MDERMDEIVARLAALEKRVAELSGEAPAPSPPADGPSERPCFFQREEQRIIDLIVGLTATRVIEAMDERMERRAQEAERWEREEGPGRRGPPPGGWGPPPPQGPPPGWPRGGR